MEKNARQVSGPGRVWYNAQFFQREDEPALRLHHCRIRGAGGAAAAWQLARTARRILILEKGGKLPTGGSTLDIDRVIRQKALRSNELGRTRGGQTLAPKEYFNIGRKTKWSGAALVRFQRDEFDPDADYRCRA